VLEKPPSSSGTAARNKPLALADFVRLARHAGGQHTAGGAGGSAGAGGLGMVAMEEVVKAAYSFQFKSDKLEKYHTEGCVCVRA
jgi:hypothetical protein